MSKLVDIENIRQFVDRRRLKNEVAETAIGYERAEEDYALLRFLDTLPEEKPEGLSSQKMIEMWEKEHAMLKEKDFRGDAERMAYTSFIDGLAKGYYLRTSEELGWDRMAKKD